MLNLIRNISEVIYYYCTFMLIGPPILTVTPMLLGRLSFNIEWHSKVSRLHKLNIYLYVLYFGWLTIFDIDINK